MRLKNYSKPITKTRKYENTKQDIEEMNLAAFGRTLFDKIYMIFIDPVDPVDPVKKMEIPILSSC